MTRRSSISWLVAALFLSIGLTVSGCRTETSATAPPATATQVRPTATVDVAFRVGEFSAPPTVPPRPSPTPRPTAFVRPKAPFIVLSPNIGLPVSRRVGVMGGNLPHSVAVDLLWSPHGRVSPLSTTGYTDRRGDLTQAMLIPASPPGSYRVVAVVGGVPYATARYRVVSRASLSAAVSLDRSGEHLAVRGRRFLPHLRLMLVAYAMFTGPKARRIGVVWADSRGRFSLTRSVRGFAPGQYVLSAWAMSALSSQVADTFFEVTM